MFSNVLAELEAIGAISKVEETAEAQPEVEAVEPVAEEAEVEAQEISVADSEEAVEGSDPEGSVIPEAAVSDVETMVTTARAVSENLRQLIEVASALRSSLEAFNTAFAPILDSVEDEVEAEDEEDEVDA